MKRKEAVLGFIPVKRTSNTTPKRQVAVERTSSQNKVFINTLPVDLEKLRKELYAIADRAIQNKLDELMQNAISIENNTIEKLSNQKADNSDKKQPVEIELGHENDDTELKINLKGQGDKETSFLNENLKQKEPEPIKNTVASFTHDEEEEAGIYYNIECRWLNELYENFNERGNDIWFKVLCRELEQKVKWFGIHHRCLLDSVLTVSNMKAIAWSDLAELTNAFIFLTNCNAFKELPTGYPLIKDLVELREKLKNFCLETQDEEYVQFRLKFETKKELLLQRYELASVFPKISFNQLQIDFKTENQRHAQKIKQEEQETLEPEKEKPWRIAYRKLKKEQEKAKNVA